MRHLGLASWLLVLSLVIGSSSFVESVLGEEANIDGPTVDNNLLEVDGAPYRSADVNIPVQKSHGKPFVTPKTAYVPPHAGRASPLGPAALRDTHAQHVQRYQRFKSLHPNRVTQAIAQRFGGKEPVQTAAAAAADLAQFTANRQRIIELNDKYGTTHNPRPFKSTSPWTNLHPNEFKRRYRNVKHHSQARKNYPVLKSISNPLAKKNNSKHPVATAARSATRSLKKQVRFAALEPVMLSTEEFQSPYGSGKRAGGSGSVGSVKGGASGTNGTRSGKSGGDDGGGASRSGKSGGDGAIGTGVPGSATNPWTRALIYAQLAPKYDPETLNSTLDWMGQSPQGVTGKIVDQGVCGSCWAQTAADTMQIWHDRLFGTIEPGMVPSVQQALDCIKTTNSNGCTGGNPMEVLDYWGYALVMDGKNTIIAEASKYPLRADGGVGQCQTPQYDPKTGECVVGSTFYRKPLNHYFRSWGTSMVIPPCNDANDKFCTAQAVKEVDILCRMMPDADGKESYIMPIVYVDASNWLSYSGGIFPTDLCSSTMAAGDHVLMLTGWGLDAAGTPYWVLKNSWGPAWGENGSIRLPFGVNACGLANYVVSPTELPGGFNLAAALAKGPGHS